MHHSGSNIKLDYALTIFIVSVFLLTLKIPQVSIILWIAIILGALPTFIGAVQSTRERRISIDTFNIFAIIASFIYGDVNSATFIILMLTFARMLNVYAESRTHRTLEELLKLKPQTALRERSGMIEEIQTDSIQRGDILIVKDGARIPVDGVIIFGSASINEASVTGESVPLHKIIGDQVLSSTLSESGLIKVRATRVGKDSTIERIAALVKEASKNKSHLEKLADRFAAIYLPIVLIIGAATYFITHNIKMTTAIFLVACADDMSVAIPLAMTAALGRAAKRGVVIKGGEWVELLSKIKGLVIDKTGTLTYGDFTVKEVEIETGVSKEDFWNTVAIGEKFSEHPIGRTMFKEALKYIHEPSDPEEFTVHKGTGILAIKKGETILIGNYGVITNLHMNISESEKIQIKAKLENSLITKVVVVRNNKILGFISVGDIPKPQAHQSIIDLKKLGVQDIRMFTGDNPAVAHSIAGVIGIEKVYAKMLPEEKLRELEKLIKSNGPVGMVGDGVNDAAALARADVGIAMGSGGTAVAVEAADIVILNDDLSSLPEMVMYSRKVMSVIQWDIVLWVISNVIGFGLVLTGVIGPAFAAFYNFMSDFFPLINSARLFREKV